MLTEKIKELEAAKAKVQDLEQKILSERPSELAGLPERYGFKSLNEFVKAVKAAVSSSGKRKPGRKAAAAPKKVAVKRKGRTRARITDDTRAKVKALVEAGKSGAAIAKQLSISLPSVQNIKKALGLVKSRGEAAPAPTETPAS
ncbi:MAG: helix-turn-helix domain-containing protein [Opitutaceae bacterium]|jgi:hypothetical protein